MSRPALAGAIAVVMSGSVAAGVAAEPATAPPSEVTVVREVYATGSGADELAELKLFVYPAAASEDAPMLVDLSGSVDPQALSEQGVSVFRPDYPADQMGMAQFFADPTAVRRMVEAVACAVRFARGSEYGSETAPLVLTGWSVDGGPASHVALAGASFDRVWDKYQVSSGGPPAQYVCTIGEASTRIDGLVGIAGGYGLFVGYEDKYGRDFLLEHEPELWETLWGTIGLHPELRVRLIHGTADDVIPFESSVTFETVLAEAGYDVELLEVAGGHFAVTDDLVIATIMELLE